MTIWHRDLAPQIAQGQLMSTGLPMTETHLARAKVPFKTAPPFKPCTCDVTRYLSCSDLKKDTQVEYDWQNLEIKMTQMS